MGPLTSEADRIIVDIKSKSTVYRLLRLDGIGPDRK